jgi:hypothetical protein
VPGGQHTTTEHHRELFPEDAQTTHRRDGERRHLLGLTAYQPGRHVVARGRHCEEDRGQLHALGLGQRAEMDRCDELVHGRAGRRDGGAPH